MWSNSNEKNTLEEVLVLENPEDLKNEDILNKLAEEINQLILVNFERLVQLLYRIDVSEMKLKILLKENPDQDAGKIIASLIIERQLQKIKSKNERIKNQYPESNEEAW
jgi:hypothetical protein